jgi:hypothetical protein
MRSLADTALLLHRGRMPADPLSSAEIERVLGWTRDVLVALEKLHRFRDFHGAVSPETVNIGPMGARLQPANGTEAPPEYRDPERGRFVLKDTKNARTAEPRHDVYAAGALLFHLLEGGPPTCGTAAPFTREVPEAAAYIVGRAMADGEGRYPDAGVMRKDVDRLLELIRRGGNLTAAAGDLPSFAGGVPPKARQLVPFGVRQEREKRTRPFRRFLVFLLILVIVGGIIYHEFPGDEPSGTADPAATPMARAGPKTLDDLLVLWRARLDDRLRAAGEHLAQIAVPLIVVSDVDLEPLESWPVYPSHRLTEKVRGILESGATPEELQTRLLDLVGEDTLPAVLWITEEQATGHLRVRLIYRTLVLDADLP